jgi:molecular chaperone GrpE (heat shock protein)
MSREVKEGFTVNDRRFIDRAAGGNGHDHEAELPPADLEEQTGPAAAVPAGEIERLRAALADLQDTKQRVSRDLERQLELHRSRVLEELLPVLDNLERTIAAAGPAPSPFVDGVKLVHGQFLNALRKFGLERRSALGERFDPRCHDAIAVVPVSDAHQDGVVVSEIEPAYVVGDRVIRPARVQVGRAGARPSS